MNICGSSPRGRGIHLLDSLRIPIPRFIPAWAGNTVTPPGGVVLDPVHPRVGGEYEPLLGPLRLQFGSSPRGRGIPDKDTGLGYYNRFIPAWAGNTVL